MKKNKTLLLAAFMFAIFSISGCGKQEETTTTVLTEAKTVFDTAGMVKEDVVADISYSISGEALESPVKTNMQYQLSIESSKNIAYIKGTMSTLVNEASKNYEIESYQVDNVGNVTTYFKENNTWYRQDGGKQNENTTLSVLKYVYDNAVNYPMTKTEDGTYVITGVVSEADSNVSGAPSVTQEGTEITMVLDSATKQLKSLKMALKDVAENNEELDSVIEAFNISIDYTYDSAVVILNADAKQAKEKTLSEPVVVPDTEETTEVTETTETETTKQETTETTEEENTATLSDSWNAFQYQFDGKVYTLPISNEELSNMGYSIKEEEKTKVLEAGEEFVTTAYGTGMILVRIKNDSDVQKTAYESPVISVQFDDYDMSKEEFAKVMLNGQLILSATFDDVKALYGEPTETHDGKAFKQLTYKDGNSFISFQFDADSLIITQVKIQK